MTDETEESTDPKAYVFGIEVPDMDSWIQPLECMVLVKGINMETGQPTMTTIGSEGITPWEAMGMLYMEMERMKIMTVYSSIQMQTEEEEEPDEEV